MGNRLSCCLAALLCAMLWAGRPAQAARCLYVSSYHAGYVWNDDIEQALATELRGHCELKKFYMDGKRQKGKEFAEEKAREALALIREWQPDVVVAADDNAAKHLVMPHLREAALPVVFCGINWTAEPYGLPYANTTGMIEVGPIEPLMDEVRRMVPAARKGIFLSADEMTQYKEAGMSREAYRHYGIAIEHKAVQDMAGWKQGYLEAQAADFIIMGNQAGIGDWNREEALEHVRRHGGTFTVTYLDWMTPFAMFGMAKVAAEQGEWAGKAAVLILRGTPPAKIPVVANRRWNMFANPELLKAAGITLPLELQHKAVQVHP